MKRLFPLLALLFLPWQSPAPIYPSSDYFGTNIQNQTSAAAVKAKLGIVDGGSAPTNYAAAASGDNVTRATTNSSGGVKLVTFSTPTNAVLSVAKVVTNGFREIVNHSSADFLGSIGRPATGYTIPDAILGVNDDGTVQDYTTNHVAVMLGVQAKADAASTAAINFTKRVVDSLNLDRLVAFQNVLRYSNRPVVVAVTTDQNDDSPGAGWPATYFDHLAQWLETEGTVAASSSYIGGLTELANTTNVVLEPNNANPAGSGFDIWLGNATNLRQLTNGQYIRFTRTASDTETNLLCDTIMFGYVREPRGNSITLQTNLDGAGYGDFVTLSANNATTNFIFYKTNLTPGKYSFRIVANSGAGTNRITPLGAWMSTNKTLLRETLYVNEGSDWRKLAYASNAVGKLWAALPPDLVIAQDTSEEYAAWPLVEQMMRNVGATNADVIICGLPWTPNYDPTNFNSFLYQYAYTNQAGHGFFPESHYIGNTNQWLWAYTHGFFQPDGVHYTALATKFLSAELFNRTVAQPLRIMNARGEGNLRGPEALFQNHHLHQVYDVTNVGTWRWENVPAGGVYGKIFSPNSSTIQLELNNPLNVLNGAASGDVAIGYGRELYIYGSSVFDPVARFDDYASGGMFRSFKGVISQGGTFIGNGSTTLTNLVNANVISAADSSVVITTNVIAATAQNNYAIRAVASGGATNSLTLSNLTLNGTFTFPGGLFYYLGGHTISNLNVLRKLSVSTPDNVAPVDIEPYDFGKFHVGTISMTNANNEENMSSFTAYPIHYWGSNANLSGIATAAAFSGNGSNIVGLLPASIAPTNDIPLGALANFRGGTNMWTRALNWDGTTLTVTGRVSVSTEIALTNTTDNSWLAINGGVIRGSNTVAKNATLSQVALVISNHVWMPGLNLFVGGDGNQGVYSQGSAIVSGYYAIRDTVGLAGGVNDGELWIRGTLNGNVQPKIIFGGKKAVDANTMIANSNGLPMLKATTSAPPVLTLMSAGTSNANMIVSGTLMATNGIGGPTNAAPSNVTIGTTAPDAWGIYVATNGLTYKFPLWTDH